MENQEQEQESLTPVRKSTADIISGARQTDQLEKLQENAKQQDGGAQTTYVPPLTVNDGTGNIHEVGQAPSSDDQNREG
ncbi:MAG: hypothetical protein REI78_01820 [Pedobacter sp.]|nr:hypothetical protein [Pedobacter sp.]